MALLELKKVSKNFDGLTAVNKVDIDIEEGEIVGVIGPNGAGKSTLFNVINGFFAPSQGEILFKGEQIGGLRPDQIAGKGIARAFQQSTLFMEATAFENVYTGFHLSYKTGLIKQFLHTASIRREQKEIKKKSMEILEFMGLGALHNEVAKNLPHGHQRILCMCIALAAEPKLLLLDEPVTGMNPSEKQTCKELIRQLRDVWGITVAIVEHDMKVVMNLCDRIVVLNYGQKIAEGLPEEIKNNKSVIAFYLGSGGLQDAA